VERLRENAQENLTRYGSDSEWIEAFAGGKTYVFESAQVVDPPPVLITSESANPGNDAENAKRIFLWLEKLTPSLAMEERLWAGLSHSIFPAYMASRWPVEEANTIRRRYLFEDKTFAALSRNGIARLWWAAYLTQDKRRTNLFELTEILFLRQDIHVSLLERALGKCSNVRTAVLDFFKENRDWLAEEAFGKRIQTILKELNLLGGVVVLDALSLEELREFLTKVGLSLAGSVR
jgi:hypothetical protein